MLQFAPAPTVSKYPTYDDALSSLTRTPITHETVRLADIDITEVNGSFNLLVGNNPVGITENGFRTFLKVLQLPYPLSHKLTKEVAFDTIKDLLQFNRKRKVSLVLQNNAISTVTKQLKAYHSRDAIVSTFTDFPLFEEIVVGEPGMFLNINLQPDQHQVEVNVGDILNVGLSIENRYANPFLSARVYTYRLICKNGAIMRRNMGSFKINPRIDSTLQLSQFRDDCHQLLSSLTSTREILQSKLRFMNEVAPTVKYALTLWERMKRYIGKEDASKIFGWTEDQITQFRYLAKNTPESSIPFSAYDIFNAITNKAQNVEGLAQFNLQELGGSMLSVLHEPSYATDGYYVKLA